MADEASKLKLRAMARRAQGLNVDAAALFAKSAGLELERGAIVEARGLLADAMGCLAGGAGSGKMVIALERALSDIALTVTCPTCRRQPGERCGNARLGDLPRAHARRIQRAREEA